MSASAVYTRDKNSSALSHVSVPSAANASEAENSAGGYYQQLCCNRNEICYTAANLEAACAPTASPIVAVETISIAEVSFAVQTVSIAVTRTVSNRSRIAVQTYVTATSTATYTRLSTLTSPVTVTPTTRPLQASLSSNAATAASAGNSGQTTDAQSDDQVHTTRWQEWGRAVVGAISGAIAIGLIVLGIWWWRRPKAGAVEERDAREGDEQPQNFARMEQSEYSGVLPQDEYAYMLQPRASIIRSGQNPYEASSSPAPPYPGSRSQTPVHMQAPGYQGPGRPQGPHPEEYGRGRNWPPDAVPPPDRPPRRVLRRPIGGRPVGMESDDGL